MLYENNIGKIIKDCNCDGYSNREYDLENAEIEAQGEDWLVVRTIRNEVKFFNFNDDGLSIEEIQKLIDKWT